MRAEKTIFITGVSSGFGQALAKEALAQGHRVIGTVRSESSLATFQTLLPERAHGVVLDVTHFNAIDAVVVAVEDQYGPVDVLVNNAGYGHEGVFEESSLEEMRRQFDVNVFGAVAMTKAFVPFFRQRRAGHILNITSMGGYITMPGIAYYCGSKFALEGISDTLNKELAPFNIFVTAVAPGSFRTDWAGRSMQRTPRSISDYDATFDPVRKAREEKSGLQLGDPQKAARAMMTIINSPNPPAQLLLGSDALALVRDKLHRTAESIEQWEALSCSTDG
ncbi:MULTISPECIES: oxidoreductase [Pseudomonas]|uniref:Oxidoreductase n=1 Tax=Pseudomonas tritici TaxID=2745518 RepID=A0A8H9YY28_9PSED|nr:MULTISPECIES: oxidoreductase [Pseudomonas]MBP2869879.1 oxidoreductase [Pseudomonas sp. SWRI144]MBW8126633.1 oxidoreductase [Pseudomonas sp. LAP_36]MBW8135346.1 oxidoreductase [Pseudomonas sp. PAMC 26818]QXH81210.1 oxidoreductase [Pseudomonas tritici]CRM10254.1 3-oxoacyl-[acyl-carrier-protein] reductase FabG [Pseudomonas sp. 58 R 12]